jgi:hypothetical protein
MERSLLSPTTGRRDPLESGKEMADFGTILNGHSLDEIRALASRLREEGYSFRDARPEEYFGPALVASLQAVPPTGSWQHTWTFTNPAGRQYAVLSDRSGIIRKMVAFDGLSRDERSDQDDLAAAVLVRLT